MNIVVCYKWVLDEADLQVRPDGSLETGRANSKISEYDRNALQAAMQAAGSEDHVIALTYGLPAVQKSLKDILSRGPEKAIWVGDENAQSADGTATARVLSAALQRIEQIGLIVCAEGASDTYAHEIGPRIGAILDLPVLSNVILFSINGNILQAQRLLGDRVEVVEVDLPAVVTVLPAAAEAPIPGLKMVLAAAKKPTQAFRLEDLGLSMQDLTPQSELVSLVGFTMARKNQIFAGGDPAQLVKDLVDSLVKEGALA